MLFSFRQYCYLWVDYHSVSQRNRTFQALRFAHSVYHSLTVDFGNHWFMVAEAMP